MPILAVWDARAAFPSLQHPWLWIVLIQIHTPAGLFNFFMVMYAFNTTFIGDTIAFFISSGVLQGCPLSGWLYAIATSPFVAHFDEAIDQQDKGVTRVCADDV